MKQQITLLFLLICFTINSQQTINSSIFHDGNQREYKLYIPASYNSNTNVPLVFSFHGLTSNANLNFLYTKFHEIADTAGFILVHPQGMLLQGVPHWNVGLSGFSNIDDLGFTNALLDTIISQYSIDQSRIYTCGMSNGGYMSFLLGCQLSSRFAAVASVTGSMTNSIYNQCNPSHPTPVLQIHGTMDPTVLYNGNFTSKPIEDVIQYWVNFNNCHATPTITNLPDLVSTDGSTVIHYEYSGGNNGSEVVHFKVINGGHDWPGAWGNQDINASVEIWRFFSNYNLQNLISSSSNNATNHILKVFPTVSYGEINVDYNANTRYSIYNLNGVLIKKGEIYSGENKIDLKTINKGIYYLKVNNETKRFIRL